MVSRLVQRTFLAAFPAGGQRTARRNAAAALAVQRAQARERREAYALLVRPARPPRRAASG